MKEHQDTSNVLSPASDKARIKLVIILAVPAVIENFFQTAVGFVDIYFVSKISLAAVSAVGVTNAILAIYFALFMAIGVAANVRIANFLGANLPEKSSPYSSAVYFTSGFIWNSYGFINTHFRGTSPKADGNRK